MSAGKALARRPLITAHTGCEGTAENSLASIVSGIEAGADAVEIDVRATADGVGILHHDPEIRVGTEERVRVADITLEELRSLEAWRNEANGAQQAPVVLLDEALAVARKYETIVNLDVKDDSGIRPIVRAVERYGLADRIVLSGCSAESAAAVTSADPGLRVLLNTETVDVRADDDEYRSFLLRTYHDAVRARCCGLNIDYRMCREELVRFAHERFLPVSVWTVNTADDMRRVIELDAFAITTYEPRLLSEMLGRRG